LAHGCTQKSQCTIENGKEDGEFDEVALMQVVPKVAMEGVLKPGPTKGYCCWV